MKWKDKLLRKLSNEFAIENKLNIPIQNVKNDFNSIGVHLAVFSSRILVELIDGNKKIESRFSIKPIPPYGKIKTGDIVLVKKSGGPIVAVFVAGAVDSYSNLSPSKIKSLKNQYSEKLGLSEHDKFWLEKANSKYATLVTIKKFVEVLPYEIDKKDRTAWVVIKERKNNEIFSLTDK